jgi:hypothetical protein
MTLSSKDVASSGAKTIDGGWGHSLFFLYTWEASLCLVSAGQNARMRADEPQTYDWTSKIPHDISFWALAILCLKSSLVDSK